MAGLYQRSIAPYTASPAMQVAASQGAAGGIPRASSVSVPQQRQGMDAAQLGGLLGMIKNGMAENRQHVLDLPNPDKSTGGGVAFNPAPSGHGEWGGVQISAYGPGVPEGATGQYAFPGVAAPGAAASGISAPGASAVSSAQPLNRAVADTLGSTAQGMALNFDPSQLGGILGTFNFGA